MNILYCKEPFLAILSQLYSTHLFFLSLSEIRYMSPVNLTGIFFFWEKYPWSRVSTYLSRLLVSVFGLAVESRELELGNPRHSCPHLPPQTQPATCCLWPTEVSTAFYHLGMQKNSKVTLNKGEKIISDYPLFFCKGKVLTGPLVFSPTPHSELLIMFLSHFTKVVQRFSSLKSWCG